MISLASPKRFLVNNWIKFKDHPVRLDKVGLRGIKIDRNGRFEEFLKLGAGQKILRGGGGGGGGCGGGGGGGGGLAL